MVINIDCVVLAPRYNDRHIRVENHTANVLGLAARLIERVQARPRLVVPNLDDAFVVARDQVRLLLVAAKINAIHADLVPGQCVVRACFCCADCPNLNVAVEAS